MAVSVKPAGSDNVSAILAQYGCGPNRFTGTDEALYERHLLFDNVVDASQVSLRERFEAVADRCAMSCRSGGYELSRLTIVRILNASIISRSSFCSVARSPTTSRISYSIQSRNSLSKTKPLIGWACSNRNPTLVWATAGWDVWRPASWIRWRPCNSPRWVTGCATNTECLSNLSRRAGNRSARTIGCGAPIPGRS